MDPYNFSFFVSDTCTLYVPFGSFEAYSSSEGWNYFYAIKEMPGLKLSVTGEIGLPAASSETSISISSNVIWAVTSDQEWLDVSPETGTSSGTILLIVQANTESTSREATVTISGEGVDSQTITVIQDAYVGIPDANTSMLTVYPNPAVSYILIKGLNPAGLLEIYAPGGQKVLSKEVCSGQSISIQQLPAGDYLYHLVSGKVQKAGKFLKR